MFNGIWLVAAEPLMIGVREIQTGERFQISRIHSGALLAQGRATVAPKLPPEPEPIPATVAIRRRARKTTTATITAETTDIIPGPPDDTVSAALRREAERLRYRRRDLEAEE